MNNNVRLRVHIVPVESEVLRAVEPVKALWGDVAVILCLSQTHRSRFNVDKVISFLKDNRIQCQKVECNLFDTSEVVNEIGSIISAVPAHDYLFNVSTGTRASCIAGIIAGMFWRVKPYFVTINEDAKPVNSERDFPVTGSPFFIPTFEIPVLDKQSVSALEFLAGRNEPMSKRSLLKYLQSEGLIRPREKEKVSPQALHGQLNSTLRKLDNWGFVEEIGSGKSSRLKITDKGIEGRKMFFHILHPKEPIAILKPTNFN